jgi:hypothetical protein
VEGVREKVTLIFSSQATHFRVNHVITNYNYASEKNVFPTPSFAFLNHLLTTVLIIC